MCDGLNFWVDGKSFGVTYISGISVTLSERDFEWIYKMAIKRHVMACRCVPLFAIIGDIFASNLLILLFNQYLK